MSDLQDAINAARGLARTPAFKELEAKAQEVKAQVAQAQEAKRLRQQLAAEQQRSKAFALENAALQHLLDALRLSDRFQPEFLRGRPTVLSIKQAVARFFKVSILDIDSKRRTTNVARPRQIAMYLTKQLTLHSLPEIGRRIGNRDHTTVLHGVRKIANQRLIDADLDAELTTLEKQFEAQP